MCNSFFSLGLLLLLFSAVNFCKEEVEKDLEVVSNEDSPSEDEAVYNSSSSSSVVAVTLWVIRHGEGWHNVRGLHMNDAKLTPQGEIQAADTGRKLRRLFDDKNTSPDLIFSSPLRRALKTATLAFPKSYLDDEKIHGWGKKIKLLPELQELHDHPSDIAFTDDVDRLATEFSVEEWSTINASLLHSKGWTKKGPERDTEERARKRTKLLHQKLIQEIYHYHRENLSKDVISNVVLVTHGGVMRHWLLNEEHKTIRHAGVYKCTLYLPPATPLTTAADNFRTDSSTNDGDENYHHIPYPECDGLFTPAILPDIVSG